MSAAREAYFETVIIGSGFSGLLAAIRLLKRGIEDFVMLERCSELGGTWRVNSYPGAEVDIPTSLYSISFVPYPFKKTFSQQSELLAYTEYVIEKYGLESHARTRQAVRRLTWDDDDFLWRVETESGERYSARFVIDTSGVLANPHVPEIPGAATFQGASFHSGQWDHSVSLKGKRVAVIGSGCSAAQIVPAIADSVSRLTLFMGKAQWIIPRTDRKYGPAERRLRTAPVFRHLIRWLTFLAYDVRFVAFRPYRGTSTVSQWIKNYYRFQLKRQLEEHINDDALRAHMTPDYELGCRRVIPTNDYLPSLSRDDVDVDISGIASITREGVETREGKMVPLDVIVYATGYYAYSDMKKALTFEVYGRGGRNLNREWEQSIVSYKGLTVSGYPNYFKVNGPNTGSGHSSQLTYMETATDYIVQAICAVKRDQRIRAIDARVDLQERYVSRLRDRMSRTVWQKGTCTAFYRRNMTGEVTSLCPEPVSQFVLSRKWFRLKDFQQLTNGQQAVKGAGYNS